MRTFLAREWLLRHLCCKRRGKRLQLRAANAARLDKRWIFLCRVHGRMERFAGAQGRPRDLRGTPVILQTMEDAKNRAYTLGATDYLVKPIDRERLGAVLRKHSRRLDKKPILVVEDDASARDLLCAALVKDGYAVFHAGNGRAALEKAAQNPPGLVLLDLTMPEMDGFRFVDEFSRLSKARDAPVIVLTAKQLTAEDRNRLNGHVDCIMAKAEGTKAVLGKVREMFAQGVGSARDG